jgi:3-hydroxyacyl-CoA dehydrogenase
MGSLSGGIFAQAGITCLFFERTLEEAKNGVEKAVNQARSEVLREYIIPKTYDDFEKELKDCDWIFEAIAENLSLKREYFQKVDRYRKQGSIVSTNSSSLSIEDMAKDCSEDFKAHFLGVHFFNPPGKLLANELIFHRKNPEKLKSFVAEFCEKTLRRVNIVANDMPGFAANRIGFLFLNEAAIFAEKYGVEKIDYLIGPYTGRALPPLATINHVGLDIHKEIVNNIYKRLNDEKHDFFKLPMYVQKMIDKKMLGLKSKPNGGFYRFNEKKEKLVIDPSSLKFSKPENPKIDIIENVKLNIHNGNYKKAIDIIKNENSDDFSIIKYFILSYISYSFFRIGNVTPAEAGIHGIDRVMSYGFSWFPPSAWVDFFGGARETVKMMEKHDIPVPEYLMKSNVDRLCRIPEVTKYLIAQ